MEVAADNCRRAREAAAKRLEEAKLANQQANKAAREADQCEQRGDIAGAEDARSAAAKWTKR